MLHEYLTDVESSKSFIASNGVKIKNLTDLTLCLKDNGEFLFTNHVKDNKNDFAKWIEEVVGDKNLSLELKNVAGLKDTINILDKRIFELVEESKPKTTNLLTISMPNDSQLAKLIIDLPDLAEIKIKNNKSTEQLNLIDVRPRKSSLYTNIDINMDDEAVPVELNKKKEKSQSKENNSILLGDNEFKDILYQIQIEKSTVNTILDNLCNKNPHLTDKIYKMSGNIFSNIKGIVKRPF